MREDPDFSVDDLADLERARDLLENTRLAARITALLGMPLERGFRLLPDKWAESVQEATRAALRRALDFAVRTLDEGTRKPSSDLSAARVDGSRGAGIGWNQESKGPATTPGTSPDSPWAAIESAAVNDVGFARPGYQIA